MKRSLQPTIAAACLMLAATVNAGFRSGGPVGPTSVHPEAMPGAPIQTPTMSQAQIPGALPSAAPVAPTLPSLTAADAPQPGMAQPTAQSGLERASASFSNDGKPQTESAQVTAGQSTFDGTRGLVLSDLDSSSSWWDRHTGGYETQQTKVAKAYQLAMSHPLAAAIKNAMPQNTLYKVDSGNRSWNVDYVAKTFGDDAERPAEPALVVFTPRALQELSPEILAAKLASMWVRHMYRNTMPVSAEKLYVEGSVLVRVFMALTGSTADWWNGPKDYTPDGRNFEIYRHFFFWNQGANYANVRQGPYFLDKIMKGAGNPRIDADSRGRMTLNQREVAGQISGDKAADGQARFDGFVGNER